MSLSPKKRQILKGQAHKLHPIVTIASKGLSDTVRTEIENALETHELLKIKLAGYERDEREQLVKTICDDFAAELIQMIGHIVVIYRRKKS